MTNFGHRLYSLLMITASIIGAAALCTASLATVQDTKLPADAKRGAVIAAQGNTAKAPACALCHAFDPSSTV
jgi:hypothetical protein